MSPRVTQLKAHWQSIPAIQAMPVQSAIVSPIPGSTLTPNCTGYIEVQGYAWSGGGSSIIRVEVTADDGETWISADLQAPGFQQPDGGAWGWVLWKAKVPVSGLSAGAVSMGQNVDAALGAGVHAQTADNANNGGRQVLGDADSPEGGSNSTTADRRVAVQTGAAGSGRTRSAVADDGERVVVLQCKAVDGNYNTQPSDVGSIWNIRGCGCNALHTVEVTIQAS